VRAGRLRAALVVALVAAAVGIAGHASNLLPRFERDTLSARFALRGDQPTGDVVVVGIDSKSFTDLDQRWPFPRSLHARAVDELDRAGARLIVYDVQFTEPTRPREDLALFRALRRAGGAVLATSEMDDRGGTRILGGDENVRAARSVAAAANVLDSPDGVTMRVPYDVSGLRSIPVVTVERLTGKPVERTAFQQREGALIDYRGGAGTFPFVSFADVVRGRIDPEAVRDRIVVVGATAPTLQDLHATPTSGRDLMSGPEVQANAIATALDDFPLRDAPRWVEYLLIVFLALLIPLAHLRLSTLALAVAAPLLLLVTAAGIYLAFLSGTMVVATWPLMTLALAAVGSVGASHVFESRERRRVSHFNEVLEREVQRRTAELAEAHLETITRLALAAEARDDDTGQHLARIGTLVERLARAAGMPADEVEALRYAAALHDIGKIALPDDILLKPGPLSAPERVAMEVHTVAGADLLAGSASPILQLAEQIARCHHERWDGSGYPDGLAGEAIPRAARLVAICDVYDALRSERPYKGAWAVDQVVEEMRRERGRHFDPELLDLFLPLVDELERQFRRDGTDLRVPVRSG
jgi:HD-GYP domain-containing protein (c-di-GMP phosphodiesterase class II)